MTAQEDYVWYASYGSNMLRDRFLCYIRGGSPDGSAKTYEGCSDSSLPIDVEEIYINSELYFARRSKSWNNGGIGFIKTNFESAQQTLGRMYLIRRAQLVDVARQETATLAQLTLNFEAAITEGSTIFKKQSFYGNLVYLGVHGDFPILTLTSEKDIRETTRPDENYLRVISKGIQETYDHLSQDEIIEYLISKEGVKENYDKQSLLKLFS